MKYESHPLPFSGAPAGISEKTLTIHHDKLYVGYVNKKNEIEEQLTPLMQGGDVSSANQSFSQLRSLLDGLSFAANGVYLHEWYFDSLMGDGVPAGPLAEALVAQFGSTENFLKFFAAAGMAARGWVVLAWDTKDSALKVYIGDAHNQGGVWGAVPIMVMDVYEHAYFIDYGSDRKAYIESYVKQLNWARLNELYAAAVRS